jgi:hypothetical protein
MELAAEAGLAEVVQALLDTGCSTEITNKVKIALRIPSSFSLNP